MTSAPKVEGCPFCGGPCHLMHTQARRRVRCMESECSYHGAAFNPGDEVLAIAAHNRIAVAARLFPEAVRLLKETSADNLDPREWLEKRDALLAEAQEVADAE